MPNTLVNGAIPGFYTPTQLLDLIGSTRGSLLYRGASQWSALTPGTAGYFLQSQGAGADPIWAAASGAGLGDFSGPAVSVDTGVVIFDGISGKNGKATAVTISVAGAIAGVTDLSMSGVITSTGTGNNVFASGTGNTTTISKCGILFAGSTSSPGNLSIFANANRLFLQGDTGGFLFQSSGGAATIATLTDAGNFSATGTGNHVFGSAGNTVTLAAGVVSAIGSSGHQFGAGAATEIVSIFNSTGAVGKQSLRIFHGLSDASGLVLYNDAASTITDTGGLLRIHQDAAGVSQPVVVARQDGTGDIFQAQGAGGAIVGSITTAGNIVLTGSVTTGAPTIGAAAAWKLGAYTAGAAAQAGKLRVNVGGTDYDILTA